MNRAIIDIGTNSVRLLEARKVRRVNGMSSVRK